MLSNNIAPDPFFSLHNAVGQKSGAVHEQVYLYWAHITL